LRFLSEFALRASFARRFPKRALRSFLLNQHLSFKPDALLLEISNAYPVFSYLQSKAPSIF